MNKSEAIFQSTIRQLLIMCVPGRKPNTANSLMDVEITYKKFT